MTEVDREDILLLIIDANRRLSRRQSLKGITRLEKLVFLLAKEKRLDVVDKLYDFKAYKFGPFSKDVYEATEFLRGLGLVAVEERPIVSYYATAEEELLAEDTDTPDEDSSPITAYEKVYSLQPNGEKVSEQLRQIWTRERPRDLASLDEIVRRFGTLPLNQIIRYVYHRYPEMAANSIHPEAENLSKM